MLHSPTTQTHPLGMLKLHSQRGGLSGVGQGERALEEGGDQDKIK